MNVRRLEAEAIRDALLAVSGRLDRTIAGPSVPPHLSPFMDGRGRPSTSGPLDGDGRRSLYVQVRRNFLTPMFLAFDAPVPFSTMGRRNVSNVPAQALTLLNDPLVVELAEAWAGRLLAEGDESVERRIDRLYESAFGRPPTDREVRQCAAFVAERGPSRTVADVGGPLPRPVQRQGIHLRRLNVGRPSLPGRAELSSCIAADIKPCRSVVARCSPAAPTASARWPSRRCSREPAFGADDGQVDARPARREAHALSGQGAERDLPLHGRRPVADGHVRSQAPARPRARPADQGRRSSRRSSTTSATCSSAPGSSASTARAASPSATCSRTSPSTSTTWRSSGRWSRTSPSTPPRITSCTPAAGFRGVPATAPG